MRYILDQTIWYDDGHYIIGLRDEKSSRCHLRRQTRSRIQSPRLFGRI